MELSQSRFLFLDCQTTGLSAAKAEILELGWSFSLEAGAIQTRLIQLSQIESVSKTVWRMTGLTPETMEKATGALEAWQEVLAQAEKGGVCCAVIHYAQFETPFLKALHAKSRPGNENPEQEFPWPVLCTYKLAQRLHPDLPARTLRALSGHLGFDLPEEHRSRSHIAATQAIWRNFLELLQNREGISTWEQLQEWLGKDIPKRSKKNPRKYLAPREMRLELPSGPGVYEMYSSSGKLLYIGKATSLRDRVNSYFRQRHTKRTRINELMAQVGDIRVTQTETPLEAALLENDRIKEFQPPYNTSLRSNQGRERPFESLERLIAIQRGELGAIELAWLKHPPEEIEAALESILTSMGYKDFSALRVKDLLRAGRRVFPEPTEEEAEQPLASVQRKLKRGLRRWHHRSWLCWLTESTVCWQAERGAPWRFLKIRGGQVVESGFVSDPAEVSFERPRLPFRERQARIDLKTHDRMRILLTELSIFHRKGIRVCVGFSPHRVFTNTGEKAEWFNRLVGDEE